METKVEEIWKDIPGYEQRYLASTLGRIKNISTGRIVNGASNKGYRLLEIWDKQTKMATRVFIHRLVLQTFVPNPQNKPCCNHKNGIRYDNRVENLEWVTHQENIQHAYKTGLAPIGSQKSGAKLDEQEVAEIKKMLFLGIKQKVIAAICGTPRSKISKIKLGLNWSHVKPPSD